MNNEYPEKRELYRDRSRAKISGVCAGISDYFGLEVWVVRIVAVSALIFFQFPVLLAYVIAHYVLEPKPGTEGIRRGKGKAKRNSATKPTQEESSEPTPGAKATVQQVWRKGRIPSQMIRKLNQRFKSMEGRLQNMESYVTSKQFQLRKEFQDL